MTQNPGDAIGDAIRAALLFLPKALAFLAILVAGWLIAKAIRKIVARMLERVGFDRMVERGGLRTALARSPYDASGIVAKLASFGVLLLTLYLAFGIWGPNPISDLIGGIIAWLPRAFVAIVIVVVAAAIARAVKDIIGSALGGLSYGGILANVASVFILGLGVIAALNQVGIATTVTTPVLIAVLATVGGILVVGVGGGLIRPMQARWESWLSRAEQESRTVAAHTRAYRAARADAARRAAPPATPADVPAATASEADQDAEATTAFPRQDAEATVMFPRQGGEATAAAPRQDAEATVMFPRQDSDATVRIPPPSPDGGTPTPQPRQDPDATVRISPPAEGGTSR
ncbi:Conserved TM helix [Micromonospora pallida]|uniref:Conserved TM helix n=1 Tax=Micromonospora pallida TaxID=145854 RepID=A0A1C6RZU8_9ACTN|nr:hypothetical protein [Micromonospora pallida]SCL22731.1 Conserved TM helix [Micromonospora pallida]